MLKCLLPTVDKIDVFLEDNAKFIFAIRKLLGEDSLVNTNDLYFKEDEDNYCVYKNNELVLTQKENGMFVESKFSRNGKLLKEARKFLKRNLNELCGNPHTLDGQQLGGKLEESGGTSIVDVAVNQTPEVKPKKKLKKLKEATFQKSVYDYNSGAVQRKVTGTSPKSVDQKASSALNNPNSVSGTIKEI